MAIMPIGIYQRKSLTDFLGFENDILVIEEFSHYKNKNLYWKVRSKYDNSIHIISRKMLRESNFNPRCCINKNKKDNSAFNSLYQSYKASAKNRNLVFNLTKERFKEFTQQNCFYCNAVPANKYKQIAGKGGIFIYNRIDRLNNKIGYTEQNSVTCCGICNHAKAQLTYNKFIQMIINIHTNLKLEGYKL